MKMPREKSRSSPLADEVIKPSHGARLVFTDSSQQMTQLKANQALMDLSPKQQQIQTLQVQMKRGTALQLKSDNIRLTDKLKSDADSFADMSPEYAEVRGNSDKAAQPTQSHAQVLSNGDPLVAPVQMRKGERRGQKQKQKIRSKGNTQEPLPGRKKRNLQEQESDLEKQRAQNDRWESNLVEDEDDPTVNPFALLQDNENDDDAEGREKRRIAREESDVKRLAREDRFKSQDFLHKENKKKRIESLLKEKEILKERAELQTTFSEKLDEINNCINYHDKYFPLAGTAANKAGRSLEWRNKKDDNLKIVARARKKLQPTAILLQKLTDAEDLSGNETTLLQKIAGIKYIVLLAKNELVKLNILGADIKIYLDFMGECIEQGGGKFVKPVVYPNVYIHKVVVGCPNYHNMPWDELNNFTLTGTHGKSGHGVFVHKKLSGGYAMTFGYHSGKAYVIDCGPKAPKGSNKYSWKRGGVDYDSPNGIGKLADYSQV